MNRTFTALCVVGAIALLAGCTESDEPRLPATPSPSTSMAVPTASGAAGQSNAPAARCPKQERDLSTATWTWPEGFSEATGYQQVVNLGEQIFGRYATPGERGQDLLAVVLYGEVPRSDSPVAPDLLDCLEETAAIVADLNAELAAEILDGPYEVLVDGLPALREELSQPGGYTYHVTWIPSGSQLLQVECQYEKYEELITNACDELLSSMELG